MKSQVEIYIDLDSEVGLEEDLETATSLSPHLYLVNIVHNKD